MVEFLVKCLFLIYICSLMNYFFIFVSGIKLSCLPQKAQLRVIIIQFIFLSYKKSVEVRSPAYSRPAIGHQGPGLF